MFSSKDAAENRFLGPKATSSIRNFLSKSISSKQKANPNKGSLKISKSDMENTPPVHPNIGQISPRSVPTKSLTSEMKSDRSDAQYPPTEKETQSNSTDNLNQTSSVIDPPVKVVVRVRPVNDIEKDVNRTVRKVSSDTVSVGDRRFKFDSVFDSNANQEDIFQSIGVPLVNSALAGYNASVVSYGQTGSGKTYTMWGPPSAMVEDPSPKSHQGIVPRVFQKLFNEINKEQENSGEKQINYQCRCSFLEIYDENIGDLLDPIQRNLEIKDDAKNGLYVENLTEEYVTSYDDVFQILIKGLSNRKVGATSMNSKSSRSHIVFTFIVESWCKEASSKCFSSSKTSRISLVDLAGTDRNKLDDVGKQSSKEGKYVKKSLSQLGHLVQLLAQETESGKSKDVLYRSSCLTHLLRESFGGNAKLTVICNVSPDNKDIGEILSTLRFGGRVKYIKNKPMINEISEEDVNGLTDQIRQLKDELIRAKSDVHNLVPSRSGYYKGQNARDSLNQLRVSLNRSLLLPRFDKDFEEEVNFEEEDVKELHKELNKLHSSYDESSENRDSAYFSSAEDCCEPDPMSEDEMVSPEEELPHKLNITSSPDLSGPIASRAINSDFRTSISINPCRQSQILLGPTPSESPKIANSVRKSVAALGSTSLAKTQNNLSESCSKSVKMSEQIRSSLRSSKAFPGATESLAASLQRGLQIIDHHQQNSASNNNRSSVSFSFEHLTLKPCPEVDKTDASLLCASCQQKINKNSEKDAEIDSMQQPTKREKELEDICKEQAEKIKQLNRLIEQNKHESNQQTQIIPYEEPIHEFNHLTKDEKCEIKEVQEVSSHHHESNTYFDASEKEALLKEIETLKSKLQSYSDQSIYKSTENLRSSLLSRSIQLRKSMDYSRANTAEELEKERESKLQSYSDQSIYKSTENLRSSLLSRSIQLRKSMDYSRANTAEELEKERERWTEMESDWICLTDELRVDLESSRRNAEKIEMELRLEKKCTEELDDALSRAVLGHGRMVEHYVELQEKYNDLVGKHRAIMEGVAEIKRAAAKAGAKGHGKRFAKSLAAELSTLRVEREKERELLKKENRNLKIQLRDTAEAVHAAGELLVRLREAEHAASTAEENLSSVQQENEKLKKQVEKVKRKHKMEMITMKQYMAESKLPESALQPMYDDDSADIASSNTIHDDDQAWRAEFGAIYQQHY